MEDFLPKVLSSESAQTPVLPISIALHRIVAFCGNARTWRHLPLINGSVCPGPRVALTNVMSNSAIFPRSARLEQLAIRPREVNAEQFS